ncbi:hypothetical protein CMV_022315 [Castanea mollissima]|uniref:Nin one binding (NOB1) Zn-ribbon-like domain-containing protein n=1 Tax=Castanea mollissima TaxID=60419 RepID=A0A8J4QMG6_9ROSI|nr:hypothetical protein CMV_022315 [Castanea mollissima]
MMKMRLIWLMKDWIMWRCQARPMDESVDASYADDDGFTLAGTWRKADTTAAQIFPSRWILKCRACYTVTAEIGRIFCPKCGNVIVLADHRPRIRLHGTKFSLPLPQGGREVIAKNLILREDQLPQKFLHPRTKKKVNKQGDDIFTADDFSRHVDKRAPLQPPVRKALAVFSGKGNPNDNHFSRSKH